MNVRLLRAPEYYGEKAAARIRYTNLVNQQVNLANLQENLVNQLGVGNHNMGDAQLTGFRTDN